MDIIRLILMQQETGEAPPDLAKYPEDLVVYNVALMKDAGLLVAEIREGYGGSPRRAAIIRMTWAGHDFLDAARDDTLWRKAKEKVIRPTASWTFGILLEWLKHEIRSRIPGLEETSHLDLT
jgi:hypothetical protein